MTNTPADRNSRGPISRREMLGVLAAGAGMGFGFAQGRGAGSPVIRTVLGDIPPASLGATATLFHEHLSFEWAKVRGPDGRGPATGPEKDVALVAEQINAAAAENVGLHRRRGHDRHRARRRVPEGSRRANAGAHRGVRRALHAANVSARSRGQVRRADRRRSGPRRSPQPVRRVRRDWRDARRADERRRTQGVSCGRPGTPAHEPSDLHAQRLRHRTECAAGRRPASARCLRIRGRPARACRHRPHLLPRRPVGGRDQGRSRGAGRSSASIA